MRSSYNQEPRQLFLNSKNADRYVNGYTSHCIFYLPQITLNKRRYYTVSVESASIPYTFYNCDYYNNILVYSVNGGADTILNIAEGNYNALTLKTYLQTVMTGFTINYIASTNKFTFTHSTHDFEFKLESTCFEIIGLTDNIDHFSISKVLTSDISMNLFTIRNIYVQSYNITTNNISNNTPNNATILCSIPVQSSAYSIITHINNNDLKVTTNSIDNFTILEIFLTDQDNAPLDLNGAHWSATLLITAI